MLIVFLMMLGVTLMDLIYSTKKEKDLLALEIMYIILLLNHTGQIPLSKVTWASLSIFIPWGILAIFAADPAAHAANSAFVVVFALINISAIYTIENHLRVYFNLRGIAEKEISKTDKLLTYMMPPHVLENMRQDKAITDKLTGVTLLYADIVGFTAWSSNKTPAEVVGMLSMMFTRFDKVCVVHNVYKVHTIGDCYVVMGYTGGENRNLSEECLHVVEMAQSMINIIREVNKENGSELNMRIGIHTGEVIAGITGTNIVRYDIYGPDVLISNKMESGGMAGKINVSDVTMGLLEKFLPGKFTFEFNKEIAAKVIDRSHKSYFIVEDGKNYVLS
jgi:class 3 adenylate cyclase